MNDSNSEAKSEKQYAYVMDFTYVFMIWYRYIDHRGSFI